MNRHDWLWIALRGTGLFFLAKSVLLIPHAVHALRVRDLVYGERAEEMTELLPWSFGMDGVLITIGVYAIAAAVFFLVPSRGTTTA